MTPQLQQAIRLLQLSRLELIDEIRKELDANPVLADEEIDPQARDGRRQAASPDRARRRPTRSGSASIERLERDVDRPRQRARPRSRSRRSTGSSSSRTARSSSRCPRNRGGFEELPPIEQNLTKPSNLRRPPALAAPDERLHRRRAAASPSSSSATSTRRASSTSRASSAPTARRTPDLTIEDLAREAGLDPEDAADVLRDDAGVRSGRRLLRATCRSACSSRPRCYGYDDLEIAIIDKHLHNLEKHNYQAIARDLKIDGRGGLRGRQGDPEAREPPGAQLHRDRREDDRHHARRLRHQGRRQVRRHATTTAACSASTSTRTLDASSC